MRHFIELLVPPRGMLLELRSGQAQGKGILLVLLLLAVFDFPYIFTASHDLISHCCKNLECL